MKYWVDEEQLREQWCGLDDLIGTIRQQPLPNEPIDFGKALYEIRREQDGGQFPAPYERTLQEEEKELIEKVKRNVLIKPKAEPEKWEWASLYTRFLWRGRHWLPSEAFKQVLQELAEAKQKLIESEESEHELEDLVLSAKHMKEKAEKELAEAKEDNVRYKELINDVNDLADNYGNLASESLMTKGTWGKLKKLYLKSQPPEKMVCSGCGENYDKSNIKDWITYWSESGVITHKHKYICGYAIPESLFNKEKK